VEIGDKYGAVSGVPSLRVCK